MTAMLDTTAAAWKRLDLLASRSCAVVRRVDSDSADTQRLQTLGLCPGRQVEVIRQGNPLIVRVFGSRLGLSAELAARVLVEPCSPRCPCAQAPGQG